MQISSGRLRCACLAALLHVSTLGGWAAAQGRDAGIVGQVTDASGAVLPGVTVIARSPALQVPQVTDVTNAQGEYRLVPLPIGVYEVSFELSGFRGVRREDVRLTVGFTARVDVALEIGALSETVTVSGSSAVVDVAETAGSTLLSTELLEAVPTTRNGLMSLLTLAPGVRTVLDVGGSQWAENPGARVFGQGGDPWLTLEGVATSTLQSNGANGSQWNYTTIEEARVQALGTDAEFPTHGVQVNAVVKSGSNAFHGSVSGARTNDRFQSNNIDEDLEAVGITLGNALEKRYDVGGEFGGRIVMNRLWFYGAARQLGSENQVLGAFKPDGTPANDIFKRRFHTIKVSFQATPANRFVFFDAWERRNESAKQSELVAYESREDSAIRIPTQKVEWQGVRGNSLVASLQFGRSGYYSRTNFNGLGKPGQMDIATEMVSGEPLAAGIDTDQYSYQTSGAVTWYRPNWFYGNHEFKSGFTYSAHDRFRYMLGRSGSKNYYLLFDDGAPYQVAMFNGPTRPLVVSQYTGIYFKDRWTIGRRLTVNAGLRYAHDNAFVEEGCREAAASPSETVFPAACFPTLRPPAWNSVAPRLHFAYDVSGDGKTAIKGGWGRYAHMRQFDPEVTRLNRNTAAYAIYTWRDPNGNRDYDAGEIDLNLNGSDFIELTGSEFDELAPNGVINRNEEQPWVDEFSLSFERELAPQLSTRLSGVHSRYSSLYRTQNNLRPYASYNIPVTNRDPGPDGSVGNGDDGGPITYYEFSSALAGQQFEEYMSINDPSIHQTFSSFEVAMMKRLANRWQFMASFSTTKKNRPIIPSLAVSAFGPTYELGNFNPNAEINQADRTWEWDGRASGGYQFPADVMFSGVFEHRSGDVYARQVLFRGGVTIPSLVLNVEPIGTQRLPNINLLNLRVEKSFRVLSTQRIGVQLNLYNALNANTATQVQPRAGDQFQRPRAIMPPRIFELSATYTF